VTTYPALDDFCLVVINVADERCRDSHWTTVGSRSNAGGRPNFYFWALGEAVSMTVMGATQQL